MEFEYSISEAIEQLQLYAETDRIEAKRATQIGASIMQTVCAFANEPNLNGGYLLLGVCEPDAQHEHFWVEGIENVDQLLSNLQVNCRDQFDQPIQIYSKREKIEGKTVVLIYVPELDPTTKPCAFKGNDKKNKKKTGVWRRGITGDYECTQKDLEPILLAKVGTSYETTILPHCSWEDLDENTIKRYRELREKVRPDAIELQAPDKEMLFSLNVVSGKERDYTPNIAGLLLFGKALSLRRLLPEMRVDYVRINGVHWSQEDFIETLDLREPLIYTIPKLESKILSDIPRHFILNSGQLQRNDTPVLPQKVVRETIVNALMHRDYLVKQPIIIAKYDDRLEVKNAGYSLKPESELGKMGSRLRNPVLASVLYDLNFAENKGSGIGVIRQQLKQANLSLPVFKSDLFGNSFQVEYRLNHLLDQPQILWLEQFSTFNLHDDETMALILVKETGSINNAQLRNISGLDTLGASRVLTRLVNERGLLVQKGSSRSTYYEFSHIVKRDITNTTELAPNTTELTANTAELTANTIELATNTTELPKVLQEKINKLTPKARKENVIPIILDLCAHATMTLSQLSIYLGRQPNSLRPILRMLINNSLLSYLYPDKPNHPQQAYQNSKIKR